MAELTRVRRVKGYAGQARFWAETKRGGGYIATLLQGKYSCGPTNQVFEYNGKKCFAVETSHRVLDVFEVPDGTTIHRRDKDATNEYLAARKAAC